MQAKAGKSPWERQTEEVAVRRQAEMYENVFSVEQRGRLDSENSPGVSPVNFNCIVSPLSNAWLLDLSLKYCT